jgi:signal peptidase I
MSQPSKSKLRYLRVLIYFIPIFAIIAGYGLVVVATQESSPFTIVTGTSMQPTILPGTIALIDKVPFDQLKVGNVIVHTTQLSLLSPCDSSPASTLTGEVSNPCFVIHRIAEIGTQANGNRFVTTKGDDNSYSIPEIDTGINQSMYLGKVVLQFPLLGYVTEQPYNEVIAFAIFVALIVELLFERKQSSQKVKDAEVATSTDSKYSGN